MQCHRSIGTALGDHGIRVLLICCAAAALTSGHSVAILRHAAAPAPYLDGALRRLPARALRGFAMGVARGSAAVCVRSRAPCRAGGASRVLGHATGESGWARGGGVCGRGRCVGVV